MHMKLNSDLSYLCQAEEDLPHSILRLLGEVQVQNTNRRPEGCPPGSAVQVTHDHKPGDDTQQPVRLLWSLYWPEASSLSSTVVFLSRVLESENWLRMCKRKEGDISN